MKSISLRLKTLELLRNRPASVRLQDISEATGLSIGWVKLFHLKGNKQSTSVDKVQTLYEHLTGTKLLK